MGSDSSIFVADNLRVLHELILQSVKLELHSLLWLIPGHCSLLSTYRVEFAAPHFPSQSNPSSTC